MKESVTQSINSQSATQLAPQNLHWGKDINMQEYTEKLLKNNILRNVSMQK